MIQKRIKVDENKIKTAIQAGIPLTVTTYTLPQEMLVYIEDVLKIFLKEVNQEQMFEGLSYCLKELVNNAKKANTKRIYFSQKHLDITDKAQYDEGMKNFKTDTLNNIRYYMDLQRKAGLYVKVSLQTRNKKIKIEIRNKSELAVFEYKRIHDKITRAQQYESVEEGMTQLLDDSEGAGLGLVIMILILRKIGMTEENFQVLSENGETLTRLILPFGQKFNQDVSALSKEFVEIVKGLPEFPEIPHIRAVNAVLSRCYEYLRAHFPGAVMIPAADLPEYFTDEKYEYGAVPSHLNEIVNRKIAERIEHACFPDTYHE